MIVALMTAVILVLSWLYLERMMNSLTETAFDRSERASQNIKTFLLERMNRGVRDLPASPDLEQSILVWRELVTADPEITSMLERTMANSADLVEINIAGEENDILASSLPANVGRPALGHPTFQEWRARPFIARLIDLIAPRLDDWRRIPFYRFVLNFFALQPGEPHPDYELMVPLGIPGQEAPIFKIQLIASRVLLRSAVLPDVERLGVVSGLALLASLFFTTLVTTTALAPIQRIEQTIDRITQGNFGGDDKGLRAGRDQPKELLAVESKLSVLSQQYSGVRQSASTLKASLDEMVERMASQLDVASRLAAISRISGGVAHEIKNPLNAISLRLDLLRAHAEAGDDDLIPEIDVLSKEVRRLDRVVKTFLDFTRPVEVKLTEVDLAALAGEVTALMTPQARSTGIELTFEAPLLNTAPSLALAPEAGSGKEAGSEKSDANEPSGNTVVAVSVPPPAATIRPLWIRGDADMLKQATLNLVTNALEVLKPGGRVRVSVLPSGDLVVLEVADNGPGIPPELRDKVFQLYFTTKEKGSGIGLALVYRAVQMHNGTVDFASETGQGTKFRLRFPASARHV